MLSGISGLLANSAYEVLARLTNGRAALAAILSEKPDIAIIDNSMPGLTGVEIIREIRISGISVKIVLLTADLNDDDLLEAVLLGVEGIVFKAGGGGELIECLERVSAGLHWISRDILNRAARLKEERAKDPYNQLTPRERQITELVAAGLRNRAIADQCGLTEGTVKVYLNRIYEKLGVSSRMELSAFRR